MFSRPGLDFQAQGWDIFGVASTTPNRKVHMPTIAPIIATVASDIQSPDLRKYADQPVTVLEDCGRLFDTDQTWYLVKAQDGTEFHLQGKELVFPAVSLVKAPKATPTIVDEAREFIGTYVALPDSASEIVSALWAIHTWAFEVAYATPYIYVTSAEPECGKTRMLETLEYIARNAGVVASLTPSTLYRKMANPDAPRPTMMIDEVDALFNGSKNETMRGILNSGYQHRGTVELTLPGRNEDGSDVVTMPTFCPKVLAGIDNGQLPPTLASRSITITLRRKRPDQATARFLARKVEPVADAIKGRIADWVTANLEAIADYEPEFLEGIGDRQFEISEPLLQIAHVAGCEEEAREALLALLGKPAVTLTQGQQVLKAARDYFAETDMDRITTSRLENATGYNGKLIGSLMGKYEIDAVTLNKGHAAVGAKNARGYYKRDLIDAIETYLPTGS